MGLLEETLRGKSLADYTNTQLRLALGAVLYTNTADMWKKYLNQIGYTGDVSQMLQKYYVDYSVPSNFRNYINAGASIFNPQNLFLSGQQGYVYDLNDSFAEKTAYRRNLLTYTDEWTPFAATNSTKSVTSGVLFFTETAVTNIHELSTVSGIVSGTTYTYQVKAKADLRGCINLGNSGYILGKFNLRTGAVNFTSGGNPWFSGITASISNAGDGYYQCTVTATCLSTQPAANWRIGLSNNDNDSISGQPSYLGVVGYGVYLKDIQVEVGSTATEYQRVTDWNTELLAAFPQTAVYLDSAGTTPASVNGLVGLVLDKSKGLALGAEIKSSGAIGLVGAATVATYNTTTGEGTATRVDGSNQSFVQWSALDNSVMYKITIQNTGATTLNIRSGGQFSGIVYNLPTNETITVVTLPSSGLITITSATNSATATFTLSSIRTISGNHAYQATTGNKPVLRGSPIGANLVTNGDFASDVSGWTDFEGGVSTWSAGSIVVTNGTAATGNSRQSIATTSGKTYRLSLTCTALSGVATTFARVGSTSGGGEIINAIVLIAGQTYNAYFTATSSTTHIRIGPNSSTIGHSASFDNITLHDVSADSVQAPYALQFDGVDDFLRTASVDFATVTSDGLARRNLLTFPTAFDDAAWTKAGVSITPNNTAAPDGAVTADFVYVSATGTFREVYALTSMTSGVTYTQTYYVKANGLNYCQILFPGAFGGNDIANFDLTDGTVGTVVSTTTGLSAQIQSVGSGWYRISATFAGVATGSYRASFCLIPSKTAVRGESMTADALNGIYIWGAQLEVGSTASAFQDIGTDKMTVCHGARKLSDAAVSPLVELSTDSGSTSGAFRLFAPAGAGVANYGFGSRGSVAAGSALSASSFPSPITSVIAGLGDISGDSSIIRVNGTQSGISTFDQGAGNFGNFALYFGRRGGVSLPFNGLMFSAICVGKATSATELANIERWTNQRTGAY
jgi:hypothetical protein